MANILRRKVYPHDEATGDSSTTVGKVAAIAIGLLGLVALMLLGRAVSPIHVGDDLELVDWTETITQTEDLCGWTGSATFHNSGNGAFTIERASILLLTGSVVQREARAGSLRTVDLAPGATTTVVLVGSVGTACPTSIDYVSHGSFKLEFTSAEDPTVARTRWIATD